jgi:hypothetical protein
VAPLFVGVVLILLILFFPEGLLGVIAHREWAARAYVPLRNLVRRRPPVAPPPAPLALEIDGAEEGGDDA